MATDVQIVRAAKVAAPLNYVVPANAELLLKAVNATFTDNGAAGDWLPCVTLISDGGDVIARAVDQGVKVTAGSSAEVSWFPGVKQASAASALSHARGHTNFTDPHFAAPVGGAVDYPFASVYVSDASVFTWLTSANPNDQLQLNKTGYYALIGACEWEASTFDSYTLVSVPNVSTGTHSSDLGRHGTTPDTAWNAHAGLNLGAAWQKDVNWLHYITAPEVVSLSVNNGDVVPHNVLEATLGVIYFGA